MAGELRVKKFSPDAIFLVDSRQFESGIYHYDERIANSLLCYRAVQEQYEELEEGQPEEEALTLEVNP